MPIDTADATARLQGRIGAEEAEALVLWLRSQSDPAVDLSACEHVHASVLQTLMALRPRIVAASPDAWLNQVLDLSPDAGSGAPVTPTTFLSTPTETQAS